MGGGGQENILGVNSPHIAPPFHSRPILKSDIDFEHK